MHARRGKSPANVFCSYCTASTWRYSPLMKRTCVKPLFTKEDATSRTTPTNVAGVSVTVPGKEAWCEDMP